MPVFMVVAPLVARSALALFFADYISPSTRPINALELFTIVAALKHWALLLQGHKFIIACDNTAAVAVINSTTSKDPFMQRCLRQLWFTTALFDFEVRAPHVPGKHNQFADCLSRWHSDASTRDGFYRLCSNSNQFFSFSRCWLCMFFFRCCVITFVFFFFFFWPLCWICSPTSSGRCVCRPLTVFCLASHYIGSRNVHTEKQPLIFAVIRLSVNWGLFSPLLLVSSLLVSILPI